MKTNIVKLFISFSFLLLSLGLMSQPPPPPPGAGHGQTGNQAPAAPIGNGIALLIGLGALYGAKQVYTARKEDRE